MSGVLGDGAMHLLRHTSVRGVTLAAGAELNEMHGLARVELHDVTDPMRQRDGVHRLLGEGGHQRSVKIFGPVDCLDVAVIQSGLGHERRACRIPG